MDPQEATDKDTQARSVALGFLEEMEAKHQRVLTELDELNARIEKVLDEYLQSRKIVQVESAQKAG